MQVQDLFSQLSFGELSNLSIGMEGAGTVAATSQPRIISLANAALKILHTRFVLRKALIPLVTEEGDKSYRIPADPLQGGAIIKIIGVNRLDKPETLTIDEATSIDFTRRPLPAGCTVMTYDTLRFIEPAGGHSYLIECQVEHSPLSIPADLDQEVPIMPALEEALISRIAAFIYSGMAGEGHSAKGIEFLNRFEQLCQLVRADDLSQETATEEHNRFADKGFV